MGIIDTVRAWANPLWLWREDPSIPLVLDLDAHQLCGVGIGDSLERLSFLGRGKLHSSHASFPDKGLAFGCGQELRIEEISVFFGHQAEPDGGAFPGIFRSRNLPCPLSRETMERDLCLTFGEPYWRDQDDDETILFYEWGDREWQVELAGDGCLKCLVIGVPILADLDQRAMYQVTKPWPPPSSTN